MKNNKNVLKLLIPVLMLVVIGGIWWMQNKPSGEEAREDTESTTIANEDFALHTTDIDLDKLKGYGLPILLDFGADSCIPCREMAPALETVHEAMYEKAIIKFLDVWKYGEQVNDFPVQVIPTQVFYSADGKPYVPSEALEQSIPFTMYADKDTGEHLFTVHQGGLSEEQLSAILQDMGVA